ncbi:leucine-rich repeat domain-containing protein [Parabacteroides sp.]|uniref:leucine-rich repeat domain-containing protein n=1 Tax=Parabacteroides sp. TaxID=1869337 RepID=UPI00257C35FF|nr:leucine-rich repeat domain-containing protein [Parabacteroides sp.]
MKKQVFVKCLLCAFLYFMGVYVQAQNINGSIPFYEVAVPKAGKLSSQVKMNKDAVVALKVQGEINGSDIVYIRSLPNLEYLELSGARIVSGGKAFKVQVPKPRHWKHLGSNQGDACEEIVSEVKRNDILPAGCFSNLKKLLLIVLPKNLSEMTYNIFWNTPNLREIVISSKVKVYENTFSGCPSLEAIVLSSEGLLTSEWISEKIRIEHIYFIDENLTWDPNDWDIIEEKFNKVFVPHYLHFNKLNGLCALYKSFGSDKIDEGVHIIWQYAFSGNESITKIVFPNTVVGIGYRAFKGCHNLSHVEFDENLETIIDEAFSGCNLHEVDLPSIGYLGKFSFAYNKELKNCNLGDKLETIEDQVFRNCRNLSAITLPKTVTYIGEWAFHDCRNLSVITALMGKPAKINNSFDKDYLTTLFVPNESYDAYMASEWNQYPLAKEGGQNEFNIAVEKPGTLLGMIGLDNIPSVKQLVLAGVVNEKDMEVIHEMVNLKYIDMENCQVIESQEKKENEAAYNEFISGLADLADEASKEAYGRGEISSKRYMDTRIANAAIKGGAQNEDIINGSIISANIFTGFKFLETVILPKNTVRIAHSAFANCPMLKTVKMFEGLLQVGDKAFAGCLSLERIHFPSLEILGSKVFEGCKWLTDIYLPEGFVSIGEGVFYYCDQLKVIHLPSSIKRIGDMFGMVNGIKEIHCKATIPPTVQYKYDEDRRYKFFVPKGSLSDYYSSWGKLNIVEE